MYILNSKNNHNIINNHFNNEFDGNLNINKNILYIKGLRYDYYNDKVVSTYIEFDKFKPEFYIDHYNANSTFYNEIYYNCISTNKLITNTYIKYDSNNIYKNKNNILISYNSPDIECITNPQLKKLLYKLRAITYSVKDSKSLKHYLSILSIIRELDCILLSNSLDIGVENSIIDTTQRNALYNQYTKGLKKYQ